MNTQRLLIATPFLGGAYYFALSLIFSQIKSHGSAAELHQAIIGSHPDLHVYSPVNGIISIATARKIKEQASLSPHGKQTIILIRDIDTCTIEAANTLLKIIEEPPENTVFICTTEQHHDVLSTILSRVTTIFPQHPDPTLLLQLYLADESEELSQESYDKTVRMVEIFLDINTGFSVKMDSLLPFFSETDRTNEKLFFYIASTKLQQQLQLLYNENIGSKDYKKITTVFTQLNNYKQQRQAHSNKKLSLGALILSTL